ncbi:MAG TPA: ATP-binding protein [Acidimicrobiales bacterium]|nr:ATP-binding protein [Acidimicrobiales bacterium]
MNSSNVAQPIALSLTPGQARRQLRDLLGGSGWSGDVDGALLALHEALVNAHQHGGGATRAEASVDGESLVVQIWDQGPGIDVSSGPEMVPEPMAERGRGLWLISRVACDWETHRDAVGASLLLRFKSTAAA